MTHVIQDESGRHRHTRRISFSGTVSNRNRCKELSEGIFKAAHFYGSLIVNDDPGRRGFAARARKAPAR